jgi:ATP-dependent RNA helicase DeaD
MSNESTEHSSDSPEKARVDTVLFSDLGLPEPLMKAVTDVGYEVPSPIQAQSIPVLLQGRDVLGQAQTGTGKTAAFALPLLANIDINSNKTQIIILAPTRELAIQVAEACNTYAKHLQGLNVLAVYGGQSYDNQLRQLKRGAQVVVGTPGRVMDHLRRKTLKLQDLQALVLDEADEMLRMGFIDDVEWILEQTPDTRQIALFSATMPAQIKRIADKHLQNPKHIKIINKTATVSTTSQRYAIVAQRHKLDAMVRVLEGEEHDGVIIFVRTKIATNEVASKLQGLGYKAEALNGDVAQNQREKIVEQLKRGRLNLLVATDVVARGLDVDRISHVINYDAPHDTESYIHRVGRTGRAGRSGCAVLFLTPREKRMLGTIERATKQKIPALQLPSTSDINKARVERFKQRALNATNSKNIETFRELYNELTQKSDLDNDLIAAAFALLAQGQAPLFIQDSDLQTSNAKDSDSSNRNRDGTNRSRRDRPQRGDRPDRKEFGDRRSKARGDKPAPALKPTPLTDFPDIEMARFRLDVGHTDQVKPGNIVGAIANEADLDAKYIGEIEIREDFSTVDLPSDMPRGMLKLLKRVHVAGKPLDLSYYGKEDLESKRSSFTKSPKRSDSPKNKKAGKRKERTQKDEALKLPSQIVDMNIMRRGRGSKSKHK